MAGRPQKSGLSYHSSDTDFYEDFKIIDLLDRYGPVGSVIYDVILKMIYRRGYYIEIPMNQLALTVQKTVGSKWIRNKGLVLQVVQYCADIGLFDKDLSLQSVLTSAGIQKRYSLATVRNKVQIEKYRLIETEKDKSLLTVPKKEIPEPKKHISVTEIRNSVTETPLKERKVNNIEYIAFPPELEKEFQLYLLVRQSNYGEILPEQVQALRDDLMALTDNLSEQIAIVKKAAASGWKSFYKTNGKPQRKQKAEKKSSKFSNFPERSYDADLEKELIKK